MSDSKTHRHIRGRGPMGGGPMMGMPVQKAKDFKGTFKRLIEYLMPQRAKFVWVFILAIASTVFAIIGPKILGMATTKLAEGVVARYTNSTQGIDFDYIAKILIFMIILYIVSALLNFMMSYIMAGVSQNTVFKMRNDVKDKLDRLPLKYFDSRTHGEILSRVTNDMDNIAMTLQQSLTQIITSVVTIAGILVMMFSISRVMTLIALVTLPLSALFTMLVARYSQRYFSDQQRILGKLNGHVEEMYTGHRIVKAFGREEYSINEFGKMNRDLYNVGWKAQFISGIIMPVLAFVNNIGYVLICVVGGLLVAKSRVAVGDIQAFIQYMRQFTHPIIQTANIANIIQSTLASAERVFEILDETEEVPDKEDAAIIKDAKGEVKFEHVNFGYKEGVTLIEDMNINVGQGHTIAIVGPTGAGKTTIINLLMRFYEVRGGSIRIDGVDIRDLRREDLRSLFGMVLQDTWLFNGTIRDNIAYGREGATEEEIVDAAKAAHADHFIRTLPEGYDTILNEDASNISQGQKQLLTIARALLANPLILILDEATSNVDTRTEVLIQKAMTNLMQGRTSFVIAHRLSTIRDADLILVMKRGSIIEQGTHKELLKQEGFYADLYNSQFTGSKKI